MKKAIDIACPICHAAVGAKCTEKVRDGSKFVDWFHEERKQVALALCENPLI